ncbi:MAG TPA: nucleotide exchange factor GrpE [Burkholderiales bacterium]|nr:nucleotide exchange factor GrpE [Burkholderiales bacterium]
MQDSQHNQSHELIQEKPETVEQQAEQAAPETTPETTPSLEEMLKKAELAAQEHHDAWLRARAEADNIRKRAQVDIANAHKYAIENFSGQILAVKDSLEAALASENATLESLKSGVELTLKLLISIFEKFNIREITALGEKFDPHRHQAITAVESAGEPNTVISVMQKGYTLNDRVIRPALVVVGKPKKA